ncbi:MAG: hypothetical protein K6F25_08480 [Bacteroidales bacterium]|nr:hypothetical protein [Bacteroidales bacterium]
MTQEASVSVRLNPFKLPRHPLIVAEGAAPVPWSPHGRLLGGRPSFTLDPLFHAGCYYVQDSSAMYVGHVFRKMLAMLDKGPVVRVLDLCAAPGGKTTDLAASLREACGNGFLLVSNEVMKERVRVLDDNVARWGDPNVAVTSADPAAFARLGGFFDIIVADVPCSGEGMFRKDPRAEAEWSPAVVTLCAARQKRILADVWPALCEGGILVYSTCTYEDAENDANLRWAAEELGGEIIPPEDEFPESGVRLTSCGNLLKVGDVPGEGQWVGAMRKTSGAPASRNASAASSDAAARALAEVIRPVRSGVVKGVLKGTDFVPDPDWALSLEYDPAAYPAAEVDLKTALHFLHRDTIVLPDAPMGYNTVNYDGIPLGFVKNLGRRCNNLHPNGRRILMDI